MTGNFEQELDRARIALIAEQERAQLTDAQSRVKESRLRRRRETTVPLIAEILRGDAQTALSRLVEVEPDV